MAAWPERPPRLDTIEQLAAAPHRRRVHNKSVMSKLSYLVVAAGLAVGTVGALAGALLAAPMPPQGATVVVCEVDDEISPVTAEFIIESLQAAEEQGAALFLLRLNTPGGLDTAMRDIMQEFLASDVPTCVFVAPAGARAASAGFMIALSADLVAMANGTNMGAATPVPVGGGAMDETMASKVVQDAVAYARSVAERRGRPVEAAAEAVSEGRSFPASEALELGLADVMADDVDELLGQLEGRVIREETDEPIVLDVAGATVIVIEMSLRQRVLSTLASPQIAYFLLLAGIGGIYFELSNPGAIFPGVVGAISLVLALLAFQQLPFSYAGLALLALGIVFIVLEFNIVSYGMLTIAGAICFVLGSMLLFRGTIPEMRLPLSSVLPTAIVFLGLMALLVNMVVKAHRGQVRTGAAGLVAEVGEATIDFEPGGWGQVFVHGEIWKARSEVAVKSGDPVEVVEVDPGLVVRVRPLANEQRS